MAWQFDRPEAGAGMVQIFRRDKSPYELARFLLRGLNAQRRYRLKRLYAGQTMETSGRQLLERGLPVTIDDQPGVEIVTYAQIK
jgi:hypothetical protein